MGQNSCLCGKDGFVSFALHCTLLHNLAGIVQVNNLDVDANFAK